MDKYFKKNERIGEYTIIKLIGEGRYGIAYLAIDDMGKKYVIKQLKKKMLKQTREKLFYEESILNKLENVEFPKFISRFKDKYREGYILEYIEGKVFGDLLYKQGYSFSRDEIYEIAIKLLDLAEILHNKNIVHRDIRLPNVIIRSNNELALIDFGLARYVDDKKYMKKEDYWYIGDFLIHLYYSSYESISNKEKPWYEELDLNEKELNLLRKLMGIDKEYESIQTIRNQLNELKELNKI